jgi:ABC-type transport system involved in multi-copper enzyme maturation permease subunit
LASPVIIRELLCTARSPLNYRLRFLVGAIGVVMLGMMTIGWDSGINTGHRLFYSIHRMGIITTLVLAPLMTADTISKERREGTLDLLFLTPLTAMKIVVAKFITQLLRTLTVWAVLIPLSTVPFLAGGVTLADVSKALLIEASIILICLSAGMLASVLSKRALPAMILALGLSGLFLWLDWRLLNINGWTRPGSGYFTMEVTLLVNLAFVAMGVLLLLAFAAGRISATRSKAGESARQLWFRKVFLTPRFWKSMFRDSMARRMDRNPLIWLEYRTAWSRGGRWALVGLLVIVESYAIMVAPMNQWFLAMQTTAGIAIMLIVAVTAASSFQKERENGAFELLLVAPFTEQSLLSGRLRALWSYYLPVGLTLLAFIILAIGPGDAYYTIYGADYWRDSSGKARLLSVLCSAVTVPIAGLYFALRMKHFLATLVATTLTALIGPLLLWHFVQGVIQYGTSLIGGVFIADILSNLFQPRSFPYVSATLATHVLLGLYLYTKTHERLRARDFA